ncbi:MAG: hypothetical protein JST59_30695, partial [Actinobacteria bacterium]|nr:hypothetical protein [Actinomycetota bacterium]
PTPIELFSWYLGSNGNWSYTDTSEIQKLFPQAQSEIDDTKREALWHKMQQIIYEDENVIQLAYANFTWAYDKGLSGFWVAPTGILDLGETSLTD